MFKFKTTHPAVAAVAASVGAANLSKSVAESQENEVPFDEDSKETKKKAKKKKKSINVIDVTLLGAIYSGLKIYDIVTDGIIHGGLAGEIKDKKAEKKARKAEKLQEKQNYKLVSEEIVYPPAIVESDEPKTAEFTVQQDANTQPVNNIMLNNLIRKYNYTDKILATAALWCCEKIDDDQVGAVIASIDTDESNNEKLIFLNSATMFFADKRFATNPKFTDIEFTVSAESLETVIRDLSTLDILRDNQILSDIISRSKEYIKAKSNKNVIIFDNSKLNLNVSKCPQQVVSKIERVLGDVLAECNHTLNQLPTGLVELRMFKSEDQTDIYTIDPGVIFAGEVKLLVSDVNGNDYFTSNIPTIRKFVLNNSYRVAMEDVPEMLINEHQFLDQTLMINYDFTNINAKMKEMSIEDMQKLEAKLNYIRTEVIDRFKVSPRMKIKNFKSIDSFQVSSDNKIPSPMEEMTKEVINGLTIKVKKDEYTFELRDENGNLTNQDKVTMDYSIVVQLASGTVDINTARQLNNTIKVQNTVNGTK